MIFGLFGSKKKEKIADLLEEFQIYNELMGHVSKVQSLQKLNRMDEAGQLQLEAENIAQNYVRQNPREKKAHMMLALFYSEVGSPDLAENL